MREGNVEYGIPGGYPLALVMGSSLFTLSDFVLGLFLIIGGMNLALTHGDFQD